MLIDGERENEGQDGEEGAGESGAGPSPAEKGGVTLTQEQYDKLMGRLDSVEQQNQGLRNDLQTERKRRKGLVRSDITSFAETLKLSEEDTKKIEEGLNGEKAVEVMIGLVQRVVHHEWGKYVTHQTSVSELMERHPDMFDAKTGRYLPNSEKGKLWEQIAQQHPEYQKNPNGVRLAMEDLEELAGELPPAKSKSKAKAEDEEGAGEGEGGEGEGEGEETPQARPHVGTGGRKPAPPKKGGKTLTKEEEAMAARYGGKEAYQKAKDSKVIQADV